MPAQHRLEDIQPVAVGAGGVRAARQPDAVDKRVNCLADGWTWVPRLAGHILILLVPTPSAKAPGCLFSIPAKTTSLPASLQYHKKRAIMERGADLTFHSP